MKRAFVLCVLAACSKEPSSSPPPSPTKSERAEPPPAALRPPPNASWSSISSILKLEDKELRPNAQISITLVGGQLRVTTIGIPIGTVIEVAGERGEIAKEHGNSFTMKMDRAIGNAAWEKLKPTGKYNLPEKADWDLPITVTLPGREPVREKLPPLHATTGLDTLFNELATTPRTWPDEASGPVPLAAAWAINGFVAIGTADKTKDVRLVVLGTQIPNQRTRRCTGYAGAKDFTATSFDLEVSIVDRVTKQPLATKTFAGQPTCPQTVVTGPETPPGSHTGPSHKTMIAWVSAQLPTLVKKL